MFNVLCGKSQLCLMDLASVGSLLGSLKTAAEIQQLILDRDETIRQLTAAAELKAEIKWKQPCCYLSNSDGQDEPYCQNCYDSEQKLSRLHPEYTDILNEYKPKQKKLSLSTL